MTIVGGPGGQKSADADLQLVMEMRGERRRANPQRAFVNSALPLDEIRQQLNKFLVDAAPYRRIRELSTLPRSEVQIVCERG